MLYIEHDTNGTKWKWQSIKLTGTKPSPRTGMSVVANTIGKYSMSFIFRITSIMIQLIFFTKVIALTFLEVFTMTKKTRKIFLGLFLMTCIA